MPNSLLSIASSDVKPGSRPFTTLTAGALSVTRKILEVLWGLGLKKPLKPLKQLKTDDGALKPNILLVMCVRVTRLYAVIVWPSAGLIDVHVGL